MSDLTLITVYTSNNAAGLAVAKSVLENAEIPYSVRNEIGGRMEGGGGGVPAELQVSSEHAAQARELLTALDEPAPGDA